MSAKRSNPNLPSSDLEPTERLVRPERGAPPPPAIANPAASFSLTTAAHEISSRAIDLLIEQLPTGVMIVDRDGRAVYANGAARALGIEHLEPLQWTVTRALLTEDAVREDEIEIVAPGQPRRWLSAHVMPVRVSGRGVNAALVTLTDVTAKTRMRSWDPVIETLVNL